MKVNRLVFDPSPVISPRVHRLQFVSGECIRLVELHVWFASDRESYVFHILF